MDLLVGRQTELDAIDDALRSLADGRGGTLLFSGEPGIGKSALARRLAERAGDGPATAHWGFCWEAGGAPAYWPWTQSLRSLIAERHVADRDLAGLAQLLPEMQRHGDEAGLLPEQARFRLLEAVRVLLDGLARARPVILVLEDLHAADADSLHLLQYLARHAHTLPLLLVGTYRDVEARRSVATDALWQTGRDARVLALARLDENAVHDYLRATGSEDDDARGLLEATEGNPLFLTELVGLLEHREDAALPDTVQQVIGQQIALLPAATTETLRRASVLGREFDSSALAALRECDEEAITAAVEAAAETGMIREVRPGRFRFSHVLHRDVLYRQLESTARQELHRHHADYVRSLIDAGDVDQWSTCATHLQAAGSDQRTAAIAAWEKSAARAHERLAYDDAAQSLQNALVAFGEGPKFDPRERCRLQLQLALALTLAGDIETAQGLCREVFAKAATLKDPPLMSEAALAYGDAIVVGKVDREHIGMLRECLDALAANDLAARARVQARLAAAMQPAPNPVPPMDMAREAIALARRTDDETVLFAVLRSAMSALMDFAPAAERIPLNREFETLAAKRNDLAGRFRSNLRLMIDAIEIGDRRMLDDAVDAAERIANRIALPHYQWRVASARAMQHMIEGDFAHAQAALDRAQELASRVNDLEAMVTLPVQRFSILCDWDSPEVTPLAEIEAQLENAYRAGMQEAEFFVRPFIMVFSGAGGGADATVLLDDAALIERTFSGGDRFSLAMFGEIATAAARTDLARRAYDKLAGLAEACITPGLMGGCWCGPVAYSLGVMARGLGDLDKARTHFETSLAVATAMRSQPFVARTHLALADIAREAGDADAADRHRRRGDRIAGRLALRPTPMAPRNVPAAAPAAPEVALGMTLDGDIRVISFAGESVSLKNSRGLEILAQLLAAPDREIHVLDLTGAAQAPDCGDAGPPLDDQARAEYRRRVAELQEELEDAESLGDAGRADAVREELDFITRELSRAYGLGGRERRSGSAAERARVNVRRRLTDAISRIAEQLPDAGRYLENTIKTGSYCKYSPM